MKLSKPSQLPRVTIDTNIFISGAILKRGNPYELLEQWRRSAFTLITSEALREELARVLLTPSFALKYRLTQIEIAVLFNLVEHKSILATPTKTLQVHSRDLKDDMVLACALSGNADYLVTGDKDLLILNGEPKLKAMQIVTAKKFLEISLKKAA